VCVCVCGEDSRSERIGKGVGKGEVLVCEIERDDE